MIDIKKQIDWLEHQTSYFKKQAIRTDMIQSKINIHESILETVKGVYKNDTTVIQSFVIPITLEPVVKMPKGKTIAKTKDNKVKLVDL